MPIGLWSLQDRVPLPLGWITAFLDATITVQQADSRGHWTKSPGAVLLGTHGPHSQPIDTPKERCLRDRHPSEGGTGGLGPRLVHEPSQQLRLREKLEHVCLIWDDFLYIL